MACFSLQWLFARKRGGLLGSSVPPSAPSTLKNWVAALARVRETRGLANAATLNPRLDRALRCCWLIHGQIATKWNEFVNRLINAKLPKDESCAGDAPHSFLDHEDSFIL